jgi:hypothetical protein
MSQEETMRLVAELKDSVSGPLAGIQKALKQTSDTAKSMHGVGTSQAREHAKAYKELHDSIRKIKETAIDVVQPGMAALGVTAFSVAGAIAAVTSAVKALGETGQTLTFINRQSGVSIGMIRALQDAGERFGISQEQTNAGLAKMGEFMDQNARRAPDALNAWNQMPGLWQRLGKSLVGLNHDAQVNRVLDFIPSVKYEDQRRKVLRILGFPEDWANLTKEESLKVRAAGEKFNREHPFAMENAKKSKESWAELGSTFKGIREDMGAAFGPDVVRGSKAILKFLDDKENINHFRNAFGFAAQQIRDIATGIERVMAAGKFLKLTPGEAFQKSIEALPKSPSLRPRSKEESPADEQPKTDWRQWFFDNKNVNPKSGFKPTSYGDEGSSRGGMFGSREFPAFGGPSSDIDKNVRKPVTDGVVEGLRQYFDSKNTSKGGGGGFTPASFTPEGGSRGGDKFGTKDYPAVGGEGTGGGARAALAAASAACPK